MTEMFAYSQVTEYRAMLPQFVEGVRNVTFVTYDETLINNEVELQKHDRFAMALALEPFFQDTQGYGDPKGIRYQLRDNYIHTSFEKGVIELAYTAFPIDGEGEPLVPDNVYTIDAIMWYIVVQYSWQMMMRDQSYQAIYDRAEAKWVDSHIKAKCIMMTPSDDELTALMDKHMRILPTGLWRNNSNRYSKLPTASQSQVTVLDTYITDLATGQL